jgi:hypothetical protein
LCEGSSKQRWINGFIIAARNPEADTALARRGIPR